MYGRSENCTVERRERALVKSERFAAISELAGLVGHDLRNSLVAKEMISWRLFSLTQAHLKRPCRKLFTPLFTTKRKEWALA